MKRERPRNEHELADRIRAQHHDRAADKIGRSYTRDEIRRAEERKAAWLKRRGQ